MKSRLATLFSAFVNSNRWSLNSSVCLAKIWSGSPIGKNSVQISILYRPKKESISLRDHDKAELSHYSNATTDIEFRYPFGVKELLGHCGPHGF